MSIRIKCPSCAKEFNAGEDLKGRTVECGVCEEHFLVDEDVIVRQKKRHYPGEKRDSRLDQFSRAGTGGRKANPSPPVAFHTANYDKPPANFNSVMPMSPGKLIAVIMGVSVLLAAMYTLYLGSNPDGVLTDMLMNKRLILFGFIALVGSMLIIFGAAGRFLIRGVLLAIVLAGGLVLLTLTRPVYETVPDEIAFADRENRVSGNEETTKSRDTGASADQNLEDFKERIGFSPVEKAMERAQASGGRVDSVLVLNLEESSKFMIGDYLTRATGLKERPACYTRQIRMNDGSIFDAGIFVLENHRINPIELEEVCKNFGSVDKKASQPELNLLVVFLNTEGFNEISTDMQARMIDANDALFYDLNYKELGSIDINRVKRAAARLAAAEPLMNRKKISIRLASLLKESRGEADFEKNVCQALKIFHERGDGTDSIINQEVSGQMVDFKTVSKPVVELLISIGSDDALPVANAMWRSNPLIWESTVAQMGKKAQPILLNGLQSNDSMLQKSAARLIRSARLTSSLPALRSAASSASSDVRNEINATIQILQSN